MYPIQGSRPSGYVEGVGASAKSDPEVKRQESLLPSVRKTTTKAAASIYSNEELAYLHAFDHNQKFGPKGIARKKRWKRAERFNLSPPQAIWDLLMREQGQADE
jgi:hypothetical protein